MNEAKFTPGPWKHETVFDKIGNPCAYSIWPCNQSVVRHRICVTPDGTTCENLSNAQLISAAPDLFEALKKAIDALERADDSFGVPGLHGIINEADAAIRKAEGE